MSMPDETVITCPACGNEQTFVIWQSVNVSLNSDLKEKILSGELVDFRCEKCAEKNRVAYPFLYHDMEQNLMIWLYPGDAPPSNDSDGTGALASKLGEGYQYRWVQSYNELVEKIYIFDAGIDDRAFELFKSVLRKQWPDEVSDEDEILFCGAEESEGSPRIQIGIMSPGGYREVELEKDVFLRFADHAAENLDVVFPLDATWPRVSHHDLLEVENE